jgi:hypothetical protein
MGKLNLNLKPDHIHGGFEWEKKPDCKCGQLAEAIKDKIIFVSNHSDFNANMLYLFPLHHDGFLRYDSGVPIAYCPWCGDRVRVKKKYPHRKLKF